MSAPQNKAKVGRGSEESRRGEARAHSISSALALVLFPFAVGFQDLTLGSSRWFVAHVLTAGLALGVAGLLHFRGQRRSTFGQVRPVGVVVAFLVAWTCFFRLGPERDELEHEGDGICASLECFRGQHQRFPETLVEAGCEPRWNRFGGWRYQVAENGQGYSLEIGDYGSDNFVLCRRGAGWWLDN